MLVTTLLAALAAAAPPPAGALAEVTATLSRLAAKDPVTVRFEHRHRARSGEDGAAPAEGMVSGEATDGPAGLAVRWERPLLERARAEEARQATEPEAPTPTRQALADLDAAKLADLLDAAPSLTRALEKAVLLEDRADALDGSPARLLVLRFDPVLRARDRKYVKEVEATARLWLGADGVPLAAERLVRVKGRAFLVVSFESEQRETFRFARAGDRLLAVRHERVASSSGGGESGERRSITTLAVAP
jgi:hypothetical protein